MTSSLPSNFLEPEKMENITRSFQRGFRTFPELCAGKSGKQAPELAGTSVGPGLTGKLTKSEPLHLGQQESA